MALRIVRSLRAARDGDEHFGLAGVEEVLAEGLEDLGARFYAPAFSLLGDKSLD